MDGKDLRRIGVGLLVAGLGGLFLLADTDASPQVGIPAWAWVLAWCAAVGGGLLLAVPPIWGWAMRRIRDRRERSAAEAAAREAHVPPTADKPVYNEGRWWLVVNRGSESSSAIRCQVFDPLGRTPSRGFSETGSGPVSMEYPNDFAIDRPLPSGEHTVVWTLGTREGATEEARTTFMVSDDKAALSALRSDLLARRAEGQALLDEAPPTDFDPAFNDWDARIRAFYQELKAHFEQSPHLGKPEAMALAFFHAEAPPLETAQIELSHFLERIDVLMAHFGGETGVSESGRDIGSQGWKGRIDPELMDE